MVNLLLKALLFSRITSKELPIYQLFTGSVGLFLNRPLFALEA
jgi:hypothetical protein